MFGKLTLKLSPVYMNMQINNCSFKGQPRMCAKCLRLGLTGMTDNKQNVLTGELDRGE